MAKEQSPVSIESLQNKTGKIQKAIENINEAFGSLEASNFVRRTDSHALLDQNKPEDRIYAITRLGQARKKIIETTIPFLTKIGEQTEEEIKNLERQRSLENAQKNLEMLTSLKEGGYVSEEELQEAENELKSLRISFGEEEAPIENMDQPEEPEANLSEEQPEPDAPASSTEVRILFDFFDKNTVGIVRDGKIDRLVITPSLVAIINLLSTPEDPAGIIAEKVAKTANSLVEEKDQKPAKDWIGQLRKLFERDSNNPQIFTDTGRNRGTRYQLNAVIGYSPEVASEAILSDESDLIDLGTEEAAAEATELEATDMPDTSTDNLAWDIPDKEHYSVKDIVDITGLSSGLVQPRVSYEISKDKSINRYKIPGEKGYRFNRENFIKLLQKVGSPKKRKGEAGAGKKKEDDSSQVDTAKEDALDDEFLKNFNIPDQGYYSTEDIARIVKLPLPLIRSRLVTASKKDKSLKGHNIYDDKRIYFSKKQLPSILKAVAGTRKSRGPKPIDRPHRISQPPTPEEREREAELIQVTKARLKIELTRVILSHYAARSIETLNKDPYIVVSNCLNSPGISTQELLGIVDSDKIATFIVDVVSDCLKRLWDGEKEKQEGIERQISDSISTLKERGVKLNKLIASVCRHFEVQIPEQFRDKEEKPTENKNGRKPNKGTREKSDFYHASQLKNFNRNKPKKRRFRQHGGSLKKVILPLIGKKAEEAKKRESQS